MWLSLGVNAQTTFYNIDSIQEIRLYFVESNWDELLDSLYVEGEHNRLTCDVNINGELFEDVGVRYKGFSSYSSTRVKNPFNIKLDYLFEDQNYQGYSKIKLSNVIRDPSFVREVYAYEVARKYMPAPQANFANVYVNDTLIGLYSNVESVNKDFLDDHFTSKEGTFFKCNPDDLDLNGENANLSNSLGSDIGLYAELYNQKSDNANDWENLYELIVALNEDPSSIASILNVDRALWMHAFNYSIINFDSYVGYAQNYYVYQDESGQFNPILWDLNMSFASFRFTDASNHWSGFSIAEAMVIDPLLHYSSVSVYPRPLMRTLFENDTYRRMYLAHIRTIILENFWNLDYMFRINSMQAEIDGAVQADTNKFYSYSDFIDNATITVSDLIDYPGIVELMDARTTYLIGYTGFTGEPTIANNNHYPYESTAGDDIWINVDVQDANNVYLAYRFSEAEAFSYVTMLDDGLSNDGLGSDGNFGAQITNISNTVEYYIYAENDSAGQFFPERAAYEFFTIESKVAFNDLVINEFMADNEQTESDEDDDFDDWIELYNNSSYPINLASLYLSDDSDNLLKWKLPNKTLASGAYLIIWADEDTAETDQHANFSLDAEGEELFLSYSDATVVDSLSFGIQDPITSMGRFPNGTGSFIEMMPTYNRVNEESTSPLITSEFYMYPNPTSSDFIIRTTLNPPYYLEIISFEGRVVEHMEIQEEGLIQITTGQFPAGAYVVRLMADDLMLTDRLIIIH